MSLTRRGPSRIAARFGKIHGEKRRENRKQKPQEEGKRRERMLFKRIWFCDSQNFNVKSCRKLPGGGEISFDDIFPIPTIFYVKMRMCNYE
jgi:hypothetical protein